MKLNRKVRYNVSKAYGPRLTWGRFGILYYTKKTLGQDPKGRDKWTNGPNTYYRAGRFCVRVRKEV